MRYIMQYSNISTHAITIISIFLFHFNAIGWSKKLYGQRFGVFSGFYENSRGTDRQHGVRVQNWRQLVSYGKKIGCV